MARFMGNHHHVEDIQVAKTGHDAVPAYDQKTLKAAVSGMLDAASHYENWRIGLRLQGGVALVLGSKFAETSWTKLAGKKGATYNKVIQRLQEVGIPTHAEKYKRLEKALVDHKVMALAAESQTNPVMRLVHPSVNAATIGNGQTPFGYSGLGTS